MRLPGPSLCLWLAAACLGSPLLVADPAPSSTVTGKPPEQVTALLGKPLGEMRKGKRTVWLYPKGTVEFEDGLAVRTDLLSDQALADKQAAQAREEEARKAAARAAPPAKIKAPPARIIPKPPVTSDPLARFVRPFIRPEYSDSQHYNNIPVLFELAKWPPALRQDYPNSVEIPVETGQRRTTFDTLIYELKKYPDEQLEQTLRCIYMIRDIRGDSEKMNPAGLAFHTEGIILEHTSYLHHEYAHQLNYLFFDTFPAKALTEIAGEYKGFDKPASLFYKDLWKRGFTSNYAMTCAQEDFAEFCSDLYLQPGAIFQAMKEYPKLLEKFDVIRPFLEMARRRTTGEDIPMDEAYFARFDRSRWKP